MRERTKLLLIVVVFAAASRARGFRGLSSKASSS